MAPPKPAVRTVTEGRDAPSVSPQVEIVPKPALEQLLTCGVLAHGLPRHHAFLVSQLLTHLDYLDEAIDQVSGQIAVRPACSRSQLIRTETMANLSAGTDSTQ